MNTESGQNDKAASKRPLISLPFLIIVGILGVVGYAAGPWLMTQFMLLEEQQKATKIEQPDEFAPLSELARSMQADPNASWEGMSVSPGGGGGGGGGQRFDPAERFAEMDADDDGKLAGDEISERLAERMDDVDSDADGTVTKEEFMTIFEQSGGTGSQDSSTESASTDGDSESSGDN